MHTTKERVRIRTTDSNSLSQIETITQFFQQQKGVQEVVANRQTGSLVINFNEHHISLISILILLEQIGVHPPKISQNTEVFAVWKTLDFWQKQFISLLPLLTGLAVTSTLRIQGWVTLPVYIIIADTTRWVIDYGSSLLQNLEQNRQIPQLYSLLEELGESEGLLTSSEVAPAKIYYRVVHTIPGRIRFYLPLLGEDGAYAKRLEKLLNSDGKVASFRINYDALSIAIAYEPVETSIFHWVNLMELAL